MSRMSLHTSAHILHQTQVKSVCVLVLLYIPLSMMEIPGPCRHSITKDHQVQMNHLINNQLRNGCSISYIFIEKKHLSSECYVKAALPRVLDLLSVHFRYASDSENDLSVRSLQNLIHNIYSQRCVPPLNEEIEEDPVVFLKQFTDFRVQALQRAKEVLDIYLQLITQTHTPVDWSCSVEYSNYTTAVITEPPTTHSTEAKLLMLGHNEQESAHSSFYKLGFIVLAVSGGIFLLITISCFVHKKRFHQLQRQAMDLDTWSRSDDSHIGFCSTSFNRLDLII